MKHIYMIRMFLGMTLLFMLSCSEDEVKYYFGPAAVNITLDEGDGVFVEDEAISEKTFSVRFHVQTEISDKDRVIKLGYGDAHTAVAGVNFEMPGEIVMEAGRLDTVVPCKVFKAGLTYEPLVIDFRILPNEDFECGGVYDKLQVKMMLGFPTQWRDPTGWAADWALGKCTQAKYKFVYEQLGTLDLSAYAGDYYQSLARKLNEELKKNPRLDDDGSPMKFGN